MWFKYLMMDQRKNSLVMYFDFSTFKVVNARITFYQYYDDFIHISNSHKH